METAKGAHVENTRVQQHTGTIGSDSIKNDDSNIEMQDEIQREVLQ